MSYCYQFVNTKHSKYLRWKKYSVYLFMKLIWNENKLLTSCLSYSSFWDKSFLLNYHHYLYNLLTFGRCRRGWIDTLHLKEFQISHAGGLWGSLLSPWLKPCLPQLGLQVWTYLVSLWNVVLRAWDQIPLRRGAFRWKCFHVLSQRYLAKMLVYREGRSSRVVKDTTCEGNKWKTKRSQVRPLAKAIYKKKLFVKVVSVD